VVASGVGEDALKNGTYQIKDIGPAQLSGGKYEQKTGDGATQVNRVTYVQSARGDLNGDGVEDAAVVLALNTGGSGTFVYLLPVIMVDGSAQQYGLDLLGDRVRIESLSVADGKIALQMLSFGPNDPMCCPSQKAERTYVVQPAGSLVLLDETAILASPTQVPENKTPLGKDPQNATYLFEREAITLANGVAEKELAPGSASKQVTRYFGNAVEIDLNADGLEDAAFLLMQDSGGSGTFFYAVAALRTPDGYLGTNAIFLGDRIAPQATMIDPDNPSQFIVSYGDRGADEPMSSEPTLMVSKVFKIEGDALVEAATSPK